MQLVSYLDPEDSGTVRQDELVVWHDASAARYSRGVIPPGPLMYLLGFSMFAGFRNVS